ncbi:hypothetical protein HPB47_012404 [Ixodes persulcatus]|uniref:Uncharacterized protein n=1 Tax=Ixodes persulcatus TaxID=34615 RepID=A0AC60NTL7_IXOPE|nr:hypothetical protein HPB47_012404 [Ixodes persulcatus]
MVDSDNSRIRYQMSLTFETGLFDRSSSSLRGRVSEVVGGRHFCRLPWRRKGAPTAAPVGSPRATVVWAAFFQAGQGTRSWCTTASYDLAEDGKRADATSKRENAM